MERLPNWLRFALSIGEIPNQLGVGSVTPVLDVGQGGWGDNDFRYYDDTQADNVSQTVISNTVNEAALLLGARFIAGAAFTVRLFVIPPTSSAVLMGTHTFAAAGMASWKEIMGAGDARVYVPPGCSIVVNATGAGASTLQVIAYSAKLKPGYKPV